MTSLKADKQFGEELCERPLIIVFFICSHVTFPSYRQSLIYQLYKYYLFYNNYMSLFLDCLILVLYNLIKVLYDLIMLL